MKKTLIERQLPLVDVNRHSLREKHLRHSHISTLHLWWARRPLALSRTVVFASLIPDPNDDAERKELLNAISAAAPFEAVKGDASFMRSLRNALKIAWPDRVPKVLDCFAGGGRSRWRRCGWAAK